MEKKKPEAKPMNKGATADKGKAPAAPPQKKK